MVRRERPELEEARDRLVVSLAGDRRALADVEERILRLLKESQGNILDDEQLINTLNTAKVTSTTIQVGSRQHCRCGASARHTSFSITASMAP